MPVTAKLSRHFYEQLGDEIANELVDWFNSVDATYRSDLDRLNELNFARFDAKLEQRLAEFDAKLEQRLAQSDAKLEQRLAQSDAKVEQRLAQSDAKLEQRLAQLDGKWEKRFTHVEARIEKVKSDLIKWMFVFWTGTVLPLAGLVFAYLKSR